MRAPARLFFSAALLFCAQAEAIVFGAPCEDAFTQSAAALLFEGEIVFPVDTIEPRTVLCSAVLIAPDVALTAAHCIELEALGALRARTDRLAIAFDEDLVSVFDDGAPFPNSAITVRESVLLDGFDADAFFDARGLGSQRDAALLFLDEVVAIPVARLSDRAPSVGLGLIVSGYGTTDPVGPQPGSVGARLCGLTFVNDVGNDEVQVGAGNDTVRRCSGDSGGPSYDLEGGLLSIGSRAFDGTCSVGNVDTLIAPIALELDAIMRAACEDGRRVDCSQPGLLPDQTVDAGPVDGGDAVLDGGDMIDVPPPPTSCGCAGALFLLPLCQLSRIRSRRHRRRQP